MLERANDIYVYIKNKILKRTGFEFIEILFILGCIFSAVLMYVRCFFGTEFTDEAFTVSDSLAVMHGNTPFAFDTLLYVGESFIPIMFYKIYEFFVPGLEGVFLYSRICYVTFRLLILCVIYFLLKNDLPRKWRILTVGILIPYMGAIMQNFSYNTIATYVTLLVSVLLYSSRYDNEKKMYVKLFVSGFLTAISVFAHPTYVLVIPVFAVLITVNAKHKEKFKSIVVYCLGGGAEILIVFIPILFSVGLEKVLYGFETMISCSQNMITSTIAQRIMEVVMLVSPYWIILIVCSVILYLVGEKYFRVVKKKFSEQEYWVLSIGIAACLCLFMTDIGTDDFFYQAGAVCVGVFILLLPIFKGWMSLAWYIAIPNIIFILFMTCFSLTGISRFYYSIPMILLYFIILFNQNNRILNLLGVAMAVLLILLQGYTDYLYMYRDAGITYLTNRVTEGVYKNIYTTPDRANDIVELETYLNENIGEGESVSFRDNVPVAYLMRNKNICDIKTWDEMQWSYNCDNPTSMYRYYKNKGKIPDVIAYVDFGRDESLSIENPSDVFQFNDFVNEYYYLDKSDFANNTFRVLIYRNNGTFDFDFDKLINSVR